MFSGTSDEKSWQPHWRVTSLPAVISIQLESIVNLALARRVELDWQVVSCPGVA